MFNCFFLILSIHAFRICLRGRRKEPIATLNYPKLLTLCSFYFVEELSLSKSALDNNVKELTKKCDCLQACTELKYDIEVSQAVYHEDAFRRHPNKEVADKW